MESDKATKIAIPKFALVVLVGISGSGKSTFAQRHFSSTQVLSSDFFRGLVDDDENSLDATGDAFEALHYVAAKRLARMRLTAIDATNVQSSARKPLIELARKYHALPVAIVLNMPQDLCRNRNRLRPDRNLPDRVIGQQHQQLQRSLKTLKREGFNRIFTLGTEAEVEGAELKWENLWNDRRQDTGPFDIIGDVHGCFTELKALLQQLGYQVDGTQAIPPQGRKAVFLGDLVDRGPQTPQVLELVMNMVKGQNALCVPGNHESRLWRALQGRKVQRTHGLEESLNQLAACSPAFNKEVAQFIDSLVSHYVLDEGRLVVAHAGMKEQFAGRASRTVREFALYGETTGETDHFGLPQRLDWAAAYRGPATVVYGHTPVPAPQWLNNTINIDTGCVFGGALTALRYPEKELVSLPAAQTYAEPVRPLADTTELSPQQSHDDVLDLADISGRRRVQTALQGRVGIREENGAAALEVMSRFAVAPQWLVYLPPTMAPTQTSRRPDVLEYPDDAFRYYRDQGVAQVICQEKHMGSRAVIVLCKNEQIAQERFGVLTRRQSMCYTRTGRRFFTDDQLDRTFLNRLEQAVQRADLWNQLKSNWLVLDCELMPWSAKAQQLLVDQYAAVGAAATATCDSTVAALGEAARSGIDLGDLLPRYQRRRQLIQRYIAAYRRYCWPVTSVDDLKLAPFHLLASEGAVHTDKNHLWHMETLGRLSEADPQLIIKTAHRTVDLSQDESRAQAATWWEQLTEAGGEGLVIKPLDFITHGPQGLVQPALKCRGREYLRIIYGPEYTETIDKLKNRHIKTKRALALREFALGLEGLQRFVDQAPLRQVHECAFGVLALESEPVDPRL